MGTRSARKAENIERVTAFWIHFWRPWAILGALLGPAGRQEEPKGAQAEARGGAREAKGSPRGAQGAQRRPEGRPKGAQGEPDEGPKSCYFIHFKAFIERWVKFQKISKISRKISNESKKTKIKLQIPKKHQQQIKKIFTVDDDNVIEALQFAFDELGIILEPSGVVGLALILKGGFTPSGKNVVVVFSGGNIDVSEHQKLIK